jgi:asparagine synthase (glutamine-hydrolysing)
MGGICGLIGLEPRPFDESVIEGMIQRLAHRGPRVKRLRRPAVWFATFDTDSPAIWPPDGRELPRELSVVLDGAIDNNLDLMQEMTRAGFPASSDPAGLLSAGFRAHGPGFLNRLHGVFSVAIHDHDTETTWLARDPLGSRPLYLHRTRSRVIFASEIRALLADPAVRLDLDPGQLRVLLSLGFNPAPNTLLKGIHKMPPGHLLEVGPLGVRVVPFDTPPSSEKESDLTFDEAIESYRSILHRTVRRIGDANRRRAGVTGGSPVLLSGGPDSSALVFLQTRDKLPVTTLTLGFPDGGDGIDERVNAWQAARALGTMHRERQMALTEIGSLFSTAARILEEPVASGWVTPMIRLLESAAGQASHVWSGQGAGALHGEDPIFRWLQWGESVADLPPIVGRALGGFARHLPHAGTVAATGSRLLAAQEMRDRVAGSFFLFDDPSLDKLLRAGHIGDAESVRKLLDRWREPVSARDPLAQALYIRARTYLPEAVFVPAGKIAAEQRIDIRFPYADSEIVHFLEGLPPEYRLEGGDGKRLHREALSAWIPAAVISREKRSLTDAVALWLRGEGKERAEGWLLGPNAWMPSVLDGVRVRRVIEETVRGKGRVEGLVLLIELELWARETFLGGIR